MSKPDLVVTVAKDGTLSFIYDDRLAGLMEMGEARVTRASHVEPHPDGGWTADMSPVDGPVLMDPSTGRPFARRKDALAAEVAWLRENRRL